MDEIISEVRIFGEDGQPIKPLIEKVEYTFDEFQKLYAPFCGDARVHLGPPHRICMLYEYFRSPRTCLLLQPATFVAQVQL